jgi:hypothetical protein
VRRRHPARPHQLLHVPPVLLVPGGEDLDDLGDGKGEHRSDERAVGEHGEVGERGRAGGRWRRLDAASAMADRKAQSSRACRGPRPPPPQDVEAGGDRQTRCIGGGGGQTREKK